MVRKLIGRRFLPTEEKIIAILSFIAGGGDLSATRIPVSEVDLYCGDGKEPWNVFPDTETWELEDCNDPVWDTDIKQKYVVTRLSNIEAKNSSRTAGDGIWTTGGAGSWSGDDEKRPILDDTRKPIGFVKTLTYIYHGTDPPSPSCFWYLQEYHLSPDSVNANSGYVLCKIFKDETRDVLRA